MLPQRHSFISPRDAASRFVQEAAYGWGRRELAKWLVCHYAPCAVPADGEGLAAPRAPFEVREETVASVVEHAHSDVLALLSELRDPMRVAAIARIMLAAGFVRSVPDTRGARAYAPVACSRMKLSERVCSLFVADCLNSPFDYRWVYVCGQCNAVSFGSSVLCCAPRKRDSEIRLAALVAAVTQASA